MCACIAVTLKYIFGLLLFSLMPTASSSNSSNSLQWKIWLFVKVCPRLSPYSIRTRHGKVKTWTYRGLCCYKNKIYLCLSPLVASSIMTTRSAVRATAITWRPRPLPTNSSQHLANCVSNECGCKWNKQMKGRKSHVCKSAAHTSRSAFDYARQVQQLNVSTIIL